MHDVPENRAILDGAGYTALGHFTLPEEDWWAYYRPIEERLSQLREKYAGNSEALAPIDSSQSDLTEGNQPPQQRDPCRFGAKRALGSGAPARIRLAPGSELVGYEEPGLLRTLEEGVAEFLDSQNITSLDIPALRSKDRIVSLLELPTESSTT